MWQDHILSITVFSTLWWYIYAAYDLMYGAEGKGFFRNISNFTLLFFALYLPVSQCAVYIFIWMMQKTEQLFRAQILVVMMIGICLPADAVIILQSPLGDLVTVVVFYFVTVIFGITIVSALTRAARREGIIPRESMQTHGHKTRGALTERMRRYRPATDLQISTMAFVFARDFVIFTISVASINSILMGDLPAHLWPFAILTCMASSVDMLLCLVFPGIDVDGVWWLFFFQSSADVGEICFAILSTKDCLPLLDQVVFSILLASAASNLSRRMISFLRTTELDSRLGLGVH